MTMTQANIEGDNINRKLSAIFNMSEWPEKARKAYEDANRQRGQALQRKPAEAKPIDEDSIRMAAPPSPSTARTVARIMAREEAAAAKAAPVSIKPDGSDPAALAGWEWENNANNAQATARARDVYVAARISELEGSHRSYSNLAPTA